MSEQSLFLGNLKVRGVAPQKQSMHRCDTCVADVTGVPGDVCGLYVGGGIVEQKLNLT